MSFLTKLGKGLKGFGEGFALGAVDVASQLGPTIASNYQRGRERARDRAEWDRRFGLRKEETAGNEVENQALKMFNAGDQQGAIAFAQENGQPAVVDMLLGMQEGSVSKARGALDDTLDIPIGGHAESPEGRADRRGALASQITAISTGQAGLRKAHRLSGGDPKALDLSRSTAAIAGYREQLKGVDAIKAILSNITPLTSFAEVEKALNRMRPHFFELGGDNDTWETFYNKHIVQHEKNRDAEISELIKLVKNPGDATQIVNEYMAGPEVAAAARLIDDQNFFLQQPTAKDKRSAALVLGDKFENLGLMLAKNDPVKAMDYLNMAAEQYYLAGHTEYADRLIKAPFTVVKENALTDLETTRAVLLKADATFPLNSSNFAANRFPEHFKDGGKPLTQEQIEKLLNLLHPMATTTTAASFVPDEPAAVAYKIVSTAEKYKYNTENQQNFLADISEKIQSAPNIEEILQELSKLGYKAERDPEGILNITPPNPADIIAPAGQSLNQQPNPAGASVGAAPPQAGNPAAAAITGGGPPINKVGTTPAEVAQKNAMPFLPNRAATGVS